MLRNQEVIIDASKSAITDYINIEYLQTLQDSIAAATNNSMIILNTKGEAITKDTQLSEGVLNGTEDYLGILYDEKMKKRLVDAVKKAGKEVYIKGEGLGVIIAAVPIYIEETLVSIWAVRLNWEATVAIKDKIKGSIEVFALQGDALSEEEKKFESVVNLINIIICEIITLINSARDVREKNIELNESTYKLEKSLSTMDEFINVSDIGMYMVYLDSGELIMTNSTYADRFGLTVEQMKGRKCFEFLGFDTWCPFCRAHELVDEDGNILPPIYWENFLESSGIWLRLTSKNIRWIDGRLVHMVTFVDITEEKQHRDEIEKLAFYDQTFDIPNAAKLYRDIQSNDITKGYIIAYDIRGLRHLNSAYGHEMGDEVLESVKNWIISDDGLGDDIYRIDGDCFAVLYNDLSFEEAYGRAKKLMERFDDPWRVGEGKLVQNIHTQISVGMIPIDEDAGTYFDLVNVIERVLCIARSSSKPLVYDEELKSRFQAKSRLEGCLKADVINNMEGFYLCYQPIVEPQTGVWVGLEALCRWNNAEIGLIPPDKFIGEAEQMGLICQIGDWVLEEAVKQVKQWHLDDIESFVLDVNLSPIQLNDEALSRKVSKVLSRYNYPAKKLSLEITEGIDVHFENGYERELFDELIETGVHIAMDDFGIGYASFASLNNLPFSTLKTDRSFMNNIEKDKFLQHTIKVMAEFSHLADMHMIAEGIETKEQVDIVAAAGADLIQGYYYSKPLTVDQVVENIHKFKGEPQIRRIKSINEKNS